MTTTTRGLSSLTFDDIRRRAQGANREVKLAHNTWAVEHRYGDRYTGPRTGEGDILVIFHSTVILTIHPDDSFRVNTGGWQTTTTKQRLNALLPTGYHIWQKSYRWYIDTPEGTFDYEDNDTWGVPDPDLKDWPVKALGPDDPATNRVTCGTCHRSWDDAVVTSLTPAPSARCPFEPFHQYANTA